MDFSLYENTAKNVTTHVATAFARLWGRARREGWHGGITAQQGDSDDDSASDAEEDAQGIEPSPDHVFDVVIEDICMDDVF